jgi:hypothetical protein
MNTGIASQGKQRFLGKLPHIPKSSDLKLAKYIDRGVLIDTAMAPMGMDWSAFPTPTGALPTPDADPLGNDGAGNCVFAGPGHMVNMIGQQVGRSDLVVTKGMAIGAYTKYAGYDPFTGANDNGYVIRTMLGNWQRDGMYGTKALAYALVDSSNEDEVALANWLGMGTIGGYALPIASQGQSDEQGRPEWSVPEGGFPPGKGPGTWGGHCIYQRGQRNGNTWGESVIWTQAWDRECCDELWLVVVDASRLATGRIPAGFAFEDMLADVKARTA